MKSKLHLLIMGALVCLFCCYLVAELPVHAENPPDRLDALTISIWLSMIARGAVHSPRPVAGECQAPAQLAFVAQAPGGPLRPPVSILTATILMCVPRYSAMRTALTSQEVTWLRFQIEFYDNTMQMEGRRRLEFDYRADYAIGELVVEVKDSTARRTLT